MKSKRKRRSSYWCCSPPPGSRARASDLQRWYIASMVHTASSDTPLVWKRQKAVSASPSLSNPTTRARARALPNRICRVDLACELGTSGFRVRGGLTRPGELHVLAPLENGVVGDPQAVAPLGVDDEDAVDVHPCHLLHLHRLL
mmetsp:Transcript_35977/g.113807  ORF Transcript_35977/g.113807 Transcript_35977/m.113807 type:complete len:144 (-) Transcript_35977:383-814(-)